MQKDALMLLLGIALTLLVFSLTVYFRSGLYG